jgi:hypothetical protein
MHKEFNRRLKKATEFYNRLKKGTLLFVVKHNPSREFVIELLEDADNPGRYLPLRYLYRNETHVSLEGAMKGLCFFPFLNDVYDTYIITEEF